MLESTLPPKHYSEVIPPSFSYKRTDKGVYFQLTGDLTIKSNRDFSQRITSLMNEEERVTIDTRCLREVDMSFIATLIDIYRKGINKGCDIYIVSLEGTRTRHYLDFIGLCGRINIVSSPIFTSNNFLY